VSLVVNLTDYAADSAVWRNAAGQWEATAIAKATYTWDDAGRPVPARSLPLVQADEFMGDPAFSGLVRAADLGPPKRRVDVLLEGAVVFPVPVTQVDVSLRVGERLAKTVRVFGNRVWVPGIISAMVPSSPREVTRVPIMWERSFGGRDASDPRHLERRNPAGSGFTRRAEGLEGAMAPNFEDPSDPIDSWKSRPAPCGFGPVAAHWRPRVDLAGTYDQAWESRRPLLPEDFDPLFFNVAPRDQQLESYVPGERVNLQYMTMRGREGFALPAVNIPIAFLTRESLVEDFARADTLVIEPEARRFSLVARASVPLSKPLDLKRAVIGDMTSGLRRALATGRHHPALDRRSAS
jgi:hypothetical protein